MKSTSQDTPARGARRSLVVPVLIVGTICLIALVFALKRSRSGTPAADLAADQSPSAADPQRSTLDASRSTSDAGPSTALQRPSTIDSHATHQLSTRNSQPTPPPRPEPSPLTRQLVAGLSQLDPSKGP